MMNEVIQEISRDFAFLLKEGGNDQGQLIWRGIDKLLQEESHSDENLALIANYLLNLPAELFQSIVIKSKLNALRTYGEGTKDQKTVKDLDARVIALRHNFSEFQSRPLPDVLPGQYFYVYKLQNSLANKLLALECLRLVSEQKTTIAQAVRFDENPGFWMSAKGKKVEDLGPSFFNVDEMKAFTSV